MKKHKGIIIITTIMLIIILVVGIITSNLYAETAELTYINTRYAIRDERIILIATSSYNMKNININVTFISDNENYTKRNIDIGKLSKDKEKNIIFETDSIIKYLNNETPKYIKITKINGIQQNEEKNKETFKEITITILILYFFIFLIYIIIKLSKEKNTDTEDYKKQETINNEDIKKAQEEQEIARKIKEEKIKEQKELLRKLEEERAERRKQILARQEAEREEKERKQREEYERKLKCKCIICNECSMGETICERCSERKEILKKELPTKRFYSHESIYNYRNELISSILEAKHGFQKEADSLKLIALAEIIENKYKDRIIKADLSLLSDIQKNINRNELFEKYDIQIVEKRIYNKATHTENEFGDKYGNRTLECLDGDFVRSKAEREIDNFFFNNRIWHIYEKSYRSPISNKTAKTDFYLPDYNLYIEYFGRNDEEYIKRKNEKIEMYNADRNINFEYLTFEDDNLIYEKLQDICRKYSIPTK